MKKKPTTTGAPNEREALAAILKFLGGGELDSHRQLVDPGRAAVVTTKKERRILDRYPELDKGTLVRSVGDASSARPALPTSNERQDDVTLTNFMACMEHVQHLSRENGSSRDLRLAWAVMRNAKIIHVGRDVWQELAVEADRQTIALFMGEDAREVWTSFVMTEEFAKEHEQSIGDAAARAPWPENFPFESVWLGYGSGCWSYRTAHPSTTLQNFRAAGIPLDKSPEARGIKGLQQLLFGSKAYGALDFDGSKIWPRSRDVGHAVAGACLGHLVTATGHVWEFTHVLERATARLWIDVAHNRDAERGWLPGFDLAPWSVPAAIEIVNRCQTLVLESAPGFNKEYQRLGRRRRLGLVGKHAGHLPPPFYKVNVESQVFVDQLREDMMPFRERTYRSDVRGHWRCRIQSGALPLDAELRAALIKRRYAIYDEHEPTGEHHRLLAERGVFKRKNEWLALLANFVEAHISPLNPDLPYIPALRRLRPGSAGDEE